MNCAGLLRCSAQSMEHMNKEFKNVMKHGVFGGDPQQIESVFKTLDVKGHGGGEENFFDLYQTKIKSNNPCTCTLCDDM